MDAFDTLGIAARFDVDLKALEARHRELSAAVHPDRYADRSAGERRLALTRAIEINDAWRVLRDPLRRAECLFERAGVAVGEANEPKPSPDFLMEMLELREELSAAGKNRDVAKIAQLAASVRARAQDAMKALDEGFSAANRDPTTLATLAPVLGRLRYFRRFLDEVAAIEEEPLAMGH